MKTLKTFFQYLAFKALTFLSWLIGTDHLDDSESFYHD